MKILKILISVPLNQINFERFDIKTFIDFFDTIQIYFISEGIEFKKDKVFNNKKIEIFKVDSYFQLFKLLFINKDKIYLDYTLPGLKSLIFKTILYFKHYKKIVFRLGNIPSPKTKKINFNIGIKKILKTISNKFFNELEEKIFTNQNIYFCAGKKMYDKYKKKNIIMCHTYDLIKKLNLKNSIKKKNYFLYIDQYEHNHPDYLYNKQKMVDPVKFYDSINNFFDKLEKNFKKKVIVAAHPKAKKHPYFRNREVISNKIVELSKNCHSAIVHTSTAISFPIIFHKPIIFIVNDEMLRVDSNKIDKILFFSKQLNSKIFNIDKDNYIEGIKRLFNNTNKKKYNNYYKNYISYKLKNKKNISEIICDTYTSS